MEKTDKLVLISGTTMHVYQYILSNEEIDKLYIVGHVSPSILRQMAFNVEDVNCYLQGKHGRVTKSVAISKFIKEHQNDSDMITDLKLFSQGSIDLIELSIKYGIYYKDLRKVFIKCLSGIDVNQMWKQHKKYAQRNTTRKLYGVDHTAMDPSVKQKRLHTLLKRYGVTNPMYSPELKAKLQSTMRQKYGVNSNIELTSYEHQTRWSKHVYKVLSCDKHWLRVINYLCSKYNVRSKELVFSHEYANFQRRSLIITNEKHEVVDYLLTIYKQLNDCSVNYPVDCFFSLGSSLYFSSTWLKYYHDLKLVNADVSYLTSHKSKNELIVMNWFDKLGINYIHNTRSVLDGYEMDFYFPDKKVGLEINPNVSHNSNKFAVSSSRQIYGEKPKQMAYHYNKYKLAKRKHVTLIQWFSNDLEFSQLQNISFPRLVQQLQGYKTRYYARQITLKCSNDRNVKQFIKRNHSQGLGRANEYWGFYNHTDELIAAASFVIKDNIAELKRLCFPYGVQVVGGLSKLISHFFKKHSYIDTVVSFSDNNLGNGSGYAKAGAEYVGETGPSLRFISYSNGFDMYSWSIATLWSANSKNGVVAKASNHRTFSTIKQVNEYIETNMPHRYDNGTGYDRIYTAGSKKWRFNRSDFV